MVGYYSLMFLFIYIASDKGVSLYIFLSFEAVAYMYK